MLNVSELNGEMSSIDQHENICLEAGIGQIAVQCSNTGALKLLSAYSGASLSLILA
jgi:hypothetical protein